MQAFRIDIIAQIGTVPREGTLPLAADAFDKICLLWHGARNGYPPFGGIGPLQALNTNGQQRHDCREPA